MHPSYFRQDDPTPKWADLNSFDALYTTLDKIIEDFRQRKLQVDFLHMELGAEQGGQRRHRLHFQNAARQLSHLL
jgi:hypothetical protein